MKKSKLFQILKVEIANLKHFNLLHKKNLNYFKTLKFELSCSEKLEV